MHFKAKAIMQRLKLEKSILLRIERIEKVYGEITSKILKIERRQIFYLLKTIQHLDGRYLLIGNLNFHKTGEEKNIYNCHRKKNIITNCIQTFTNIDTRTL